MQASSLPVPLARAVMSLMPAPVLARGMAIVLQRMQGRRPKLFKNLSQLAPATVHLLPSDLPHGFALTMGCTPVSFTLVEEGAATPDASISGTLEALVAMLEGRIDGDQLFFSREIQIAGDTSVIVALRNTMDREEIDLYADILSLCGPFAQPARMAIGLADKMARRLHEKMNGRRDDLHRTSKATVS